MRVVRVAVRDHEGSRECDCWLMLERQGGVCEGGLSVMRKKNAACSGCCQSVKGPCSLAGLCVTLSRPSPPHLCGGVLCARAWPRCA